MDLISSMLLGNNTKTNIKNIIWLKPWHWNKNLSRFRWVARKGIWTRSTRLKFRFFIMKCPPQNSKLLGKRVRRKVWGCSKEGEIRQLTLRWCGHTQFQTLNTAEAIFPNIWTVPSFERFFYLHLRCDSVPNCMRDMNTYLVLSAFTSRAPSKNQPLAFTSQKG